MYWLRVGRAAGRAPESAAAATRRQARRLRARTPQLAATRALAAGCGAQNQTVAQSNLPNVNFAVTGSGAPTLALATNYLGTYNGVNNDANLSPGINGSFRAGTVSGSIAVTGHAASGGLGTALVTLPPALIVTKAIKY